MSDPANHAQVKKAVLPPQVAAVVDRVKGFFMGLSKGARVLIVSTGLLAAIFVGYLAFHATNVDYATLYTNLDADDASSVVTKLKEMKVPYRLAANGTTIEVPEKQALDLRLELASAGLPRGGGVGFESFDKMRLGATEFEQRVLYRRALEGELSRTIDTIGAVQSSRVHLVMPEKSVFVSRQEPASASIVVKLKTSKTLGPQEVAGVVHLAASAVPGLTAEAVTLVTTEGVMLHRPKKSGDGEAEGDPNEPSASKALESSLSDRAREMIERIVGPGHVDVQVSADLDTARVEHVEDHYNPATAVMRSEEQTTERQGSGPDDTVAGVPGAESNVPGGSSVTPIGKPSASATPAASAASASSAAASASAMIASLPAPQVAANTQKGLPAGMMRESHTRNFEIDHVSDKRVLGPGALRRLTVAVVVDGVETTVDGKTTTTERSPEQMAKIASLVRGAVGIDDKRGDILTVETVPFLAAPADPTAVAVDAPKPFDLSHFDYKAHAKLLAGVGGSAVLLFMLAGLSLRKRSKKAAAARALALAEAEKSKTPQFGPSPVPAQIEINPKTPEDVRQAAHERAMMDPATAALVLKAWLGAGENEEKMAIAS